MQGLLLLDKPEGITSFGAVARIKRLSGEKRVGHTGTLDPLATGLLPIFIGRATSLCSYLLDADKSYTARVRLGVTTDTCDSTGTVLSNCKPDVSRERLNEVFKTFTGEIEQIPPMYSAIKRDGVRLYQLAREGKTVELEPRKIVIRSLSMTDFDGEEFTLTVTCSKGTYIRSLCRDIGEALGCGATMTALRRTATSGFSIDQSVPLENLTADNLAEQIISEEAAVMNLRAVTVTEKQAKRFTCGGQLAFERLKSSDFAENERFRVKYGDRLLGIGRADTEKQELAVDCVLYQF